MAVRPATLALAPLGDLLELKGDDRLVLLYPRDQMNQMNPLGAEIKLHFCQPPDWLEQPLDRLEGIPRYVDAQGKYVLFIFHKTLDTIAPLQLSGLHCEIVKRPSEWAVKHLNFGAWVGRFGIGVFYLCRPHPQVRARKQTPGR